jgi:hypothetical protein
MNNSKVCRVCYNVFGNFRTHCPACGAIPVLNRDYTIHEDRAIQIAPAYGAMRASQGLQNRVLWIQSCDGD